MKHKEKIWKKKKPTPEQNMYLWDNFESNWDIRKRRDQSRTDILSKNGWEFFKVNVRHQTTDVGSSENTKQNLYRKKLHLGISYSSFRKPKTKRNSFFHMCHCDTGYSPFSILFLKYIYTKPVCKFLPKSGVKITTESQKTEC